MTGRTKRCVFTTNILASTKFDQVASKPRLASAMDAMEAGAAPQASGALHDGVGRCLDMESDRSPAGAVRGRSASPLAGDVATPSLGAGRSQPDTVKRATRGRARTLSRTHTLPQAAKPAVDALFSHSISLGEQSMQYSTLCLCERVCKTWRNAVGESLKQLMRLDFQGHHTKQWRSFWQQVCNEGVVLRALARVGDCLSHLDLSGTEVRDPCANTDARAYRTLSHMRACMHAEHRACWATPSGRTV